MNGNRSRYTYIPTYGMQKRGMLKKNAPVRDVPETPDFTQIPDPAVGVPLQQTYYQTPYQPSAPQAGAMPPPSYFNAPTQPVQQPMQQPVQQMPVQTPFAAPNFVQSGNYNQMPPVQNYQQSSYQPPIRSNMTSAAPASGFSTRAQGFVPPTQAAQPVQPAQPVQQYQSPAPQIGWNTGKPAQQPIPPFSAPQTPVQPTRPFQPVTPPQGFPSLQPVAQQPGFTIQTTAPVEPPRAAEFDADKLWSIFLFGLLPLLFIPCIFVSGALDVLRYIFLGATVIGLGGMWYRQQYTPITRLVVSVIYTTICIVTIAMLMHNTGATRQTASTVNPNTQQQVHTTPMPSADANAVVAATETPAPAPTVVGPSEAEKRLSLFMDLWKMNNTTEMVNLVQPSWRNQQENAATSLFLALANRTPEDFVIEDIGGTETDSSRTITMRATINKNTGKAPVVYRFMVMMVKEGTEWYVNPNSLATNDTSVSITEDANVVKTQSSGTVTEPPRETVTPAPPASTLLYYNIGGNYYHMDPQCPSVAKDFLPFDASFSYSDLRSYNSSLLPCLNCNAPIDPL